MVLIFSITAMITGITTKVFACETTLSSLTGSRMKETSVFFYWNFDLQHFDNVCRKRDDYSEVFACLFVRVI